MSRLKVPRLRAESVIPILAGIAAPALLVAVGPGLGRWPSAVDAVVLGEAALLGYTAALSGCTRGSPPAAPALAPCGHLAAPRTQQPPTR